MTVTHTHNVDYQTMECTDCHATVEQINKGELAHPGKPTSERLWETKKKVFMQVWKEQER